MIIGSNIQIFIQLKIKNILYLSGDSHTKHKGLYIACNDTNMCNSCNIFESNSLNILTTRLK